MLGVLVSGQMQAAVGDLPLPVSLVPKCSPEPGSDRHGAAAAVLTAHLKHLESPWQAWRGRGGWLHPPAAALGLARCRGGARGTQPQAEHSSPQPHCCAGWICVDHSFFQACSHPENSSPAVISSIRFTFEPSVGCWAPPHWQ